MEKIDFCLVHLVLPPRGIGCYLSRYGFSSARRARASAGLRVEESPLFSELPWFDFPGSHAQ